MSAVTNPNKNNFFYTAPKDVIHEVMLRLDASSIAAMRAACQRFAVIGSDEKLYTSHDDQERRKAFKRVGDFKGALERLSVIQSLQQNNLPQSLAARSAVLFSRWMSPEAYTNGQKSQAAKNEEISRLTEELSKYKSEKSISSNAPLGKSLFAAQVEFLYTSSNISPQNFSRKVIVALLGGTEKFNNLPVYTPVTTPDNLDNICLEAITIETVTAPIMRGVDLFNREFVLIRYKEHGELKLNLIFQTDTDKDIWVSSKEKMGNICLRYPSLMFSPSEFILVRGYTMTDGLEKMAEFIIDRGNSVAQIQ